MLPIELIDQPEQMVLAIRTRSRVENLPSLIGMSYQRIAAYLAACGASPAGAPYAAYFNQDMSDLDVELGFPITKACADNGDLHCHAIPAGRAVAALYKGSYSGLTAAYDAMKAWMASNGLEPSGIAYEYYFTGPEVPETEQVTRIVLPVR